MREMPATTDRSRSEWLGQPRGLAILFLTEMWEKFSFFGMRALLVYYMTSQLAFAQSKASIIYGIYTGAVFLAPMIGAPISDRWIGRRRAVILGATIMAAGHFMMAFEPLFFVALVTIAAGSGLLLPNLPSQIEGLYAEDDPRRQTAYNIYYVGINTGALIAPFICGTIGELYGWHYGFGLAGAGVLVGLVVYTWGMRYLPAEGDRMGRKVAARAAAAQASSLARYRLLILIAAIVAVLRASYEQIGNTIAIWAETGIDRSISSDILIPMTWFQSLNPFLVFTLTPLFVWRWNRQARQGREPTPLRKMAVGAVLICLAYLLLAFLSVRADARNVPVGWQWLAVYFVLMTAGELYVFPIGLGLFARLAPAGFTATAIATWYLAGFVGNVLAGMMGSLWSVFTHGEFFLLMGLLAALSAALFLLFDGHAQRSSRAFSAAPA
jgi:POT family proton-dependent oligopeptide transporter